MECVDYCVIWSYTGIDSFFSLCIQLVYCEWVNAYRLGHEYNQLLSIKLGIVSLHAMYIYV